MELAMLPAVISVGWSTRGPFHRVIEHNLEVIKCAGLII